MFWGRTESVERLALIFCTFFADRRITEQFIQLFKKDTEEIVTIDHYIDQAMVSAVKLDALDPFILEVVPK